jgi:DNA mismatch repair protein MutL
VTRAFDGLAVTGVVGEPDLARRDSKLELLFVNGRLARESSALYAVRQAFRDYLMGGRFPIYALQLALPAEEVDVNVHPRKAEVRFVEARKVAGCLHETVRAALQARGGAGAAVGGVVVAPDLPRARSGFPAMGSTLFGDEAVAAAPVPPQPLPATAAATAAVVREPAGPFAAAAPGARAPARPNPFQRVSGRYLQVMDLYLLLEGPDGLLVVDQHALHERVMYEALQRRHRARDVQSQRLLLPVVVELQPSELAWFASAHDALAAEGLVVEPFGPGTVAVHAVPAVLARADVKQLVRSLVVGDEAPGSAPLRGVVAERFHSMACRSAVMSGDRLRDDEIRQLLADAATLVHPHNCPHGRPTVLTFTTAELERYFRRRC